MTGVWANRRDKKRPHAVHDPGPREEERVYLCNHPIASIRLSQKSLRDCLRGRLLDDVRFPRR